MEEEVVRSVSLKDYERLKEYIQALERTRADLWGVNEELRNKIQALEEGQERVIQAVQNYVMETKRSLLDRPDCSGLTPTPFNLDLFLRHYGFQDPDEIQYPRPPASVL